MIEFLFELDHDGIYSDWIIETSDEDSISDIVSNEVSKVSNSCTLSKIEHFSVLITCNGKRLYSRDLIVKGFVK